MPENTVNVCRPGKYGNPFLIGEVCLYDDEWVKVEDAEHATELYRIFLEQQLMIHNEITIKALEYLRGKDLACWCKKGDSCHADVLLEMANR